MAEVPFHTKTEKLMSTQIQNLSHKEMDMNGMEWNGME
jgi:hypothetical protein